jgi:hypothetical protein
MNKIKLMLLRKQKRLNTMTSELLSMTLRLPWTTQLPVLRNTKKTVMTAPPTANPTSKKHKQLMMHLQNTKWTSIWLRVHLILSMKISDVNKKKQD